MLMNDKIILDCYNCRFIEGKQKIMKGLQRLIMLQQIQCLVQKFIALFKIRCCLKNLFASTCSRSIISAEINILFDGTITAQVY